MRFQQETVTVQGSEFTSEGRLRAPQEAVWLTFQWDSQAFPLVYSLMHHLNMHAFAFRMQFLLVVSEPLPPFLFYELFSSFH